MGFGPNLIRADRAGNKMKLKAILAVAAAAGLTQVASALPTTLTIGNLTYSDFAVTGASAGDVNVIAAPTIPAGEYAGIEITGPFTAIGGAADFSFQYTVTVNGDGNLIHDIGQAYTLSQNSSGVVSIQEHVWDQGFSLGNEIATSVLSLTDNQDPDAETVQGDNLVMLVPQHKVWVTKNIHLAPTTVLDPNSGRLTTSTIGTATLFQYVSEVPDGGSTLILLGLGFSGVALVVRFKDKFAKNF
jgi:hypothetical protein